jgi:aminoglycoside 6'-N-acetyltransferase I
VSEVWIRAATPADCEQLSRLRKALWPESSAEEHARELASLLKERKNGTMPLAIFVAEALGGLCPPTFAQARGTRRIMPTSALVGFLEAGLRSHADGCDPTRPVGFVEGWFVLDAIAEKARAHVSSRRLKNGRGATAASRWHPILG